jgi:hypothetical protein
MSNRNGIGNETWLGRVKRKTVLHRSRHYVFVKPLGQCFNTSRRSVGLTKRNSPPAMHIYQPGSLQGSNYHQWYHVSLTWSRLILPYIPILCNSCLHSQHSSIGWIRRVGNHWYGRSQGGLQRFSGHYCPVTPSEQWVLKGNYFKNSRVLKSYHALKAHWKTKRPLTSWREIPLENVSSNYTTKILGGLYNQINK